MFTNSSTPKLLFAALGIAGTSLVVACGGGSDGGTDGPSVTVSSVALSVNGTPNIASFTDTRTLTALAKDANGGIIASPSLTWTSSAPAVATVSGSGNTATVTAVGNGTATITASSGSAQGTTDITVAQVATTVAILNMPATLIPGTTAQLSAEARDANGRAVAGATGFAFASANDAVAVVSPTGALLAIAPGTAQITGNATIAGTALTGNSPATVAFAAAATGAATADVAATAGNQFTPAVVTIRTGGTVTWNFAAVQHNVTFGGTSGAPANIPNSASASADRTFNTAGSFDYQCTLHPGMTGTVTVQAGGAATGTLTTLLNGANERPTPITTNGAGAAIFTINGTSVNYVVTFARLSGAPIMAHIHGPGNSTQAVGVLVDFPTAGQTLNNGVLTGTFNAASIRNAAISLDSLLVLMRNGNAYVNVHTTQNPAGEIRGQLGAP